MAFIKVLVGLFSAFVLIALIAHSADAVSPPLEEAPSQYPGTGKITKRAVNGPGYRCTPGDKFKDDCNDCTCTADGKSAYCTLRVCSFPVPKLPQIPTVAE